MEDVLLEIIQNDNDRNIKETCNEELINWIKICDLGNNKDDALLNLTLKLYQTWPPRS